MRWDDGTWRPCHIEYWHHPEGGYRHLLGARIFDWLALVRHAGGMADADGWYCFEPRYLRSASPGRDRPEQRPLAQRGLTSSRERSQSGLPREQVMHGA